MGYYAFTYSMGLWVSEQKAELECNGVDTPQTVMTTRAPAVLRNMEDPLAKCCKTRQSGKFKMFNERVSE